MKKALLLLLLTISFAATAQVVNIPDANFKNYLLSIGITTNVTNSSGNPIKINANNDNEIQVSEAEAVYGFIINGFYSLQFQNFTGLEAFTNLRKLTIGYFNGTFLLNLSTMHHLEELNIDSIQFININFSSTPSLKKIDIATRLELASPDFLLTQTNLEYITLKAFQLQGLNLTGLNNLKEFVCGIFSLEYANNIFSALTLAGNTSLTKLKIYNTNVTNINFGGAPNLKEIDARNNKLQQVNLQGLTQLEYINFFTNNISGVVDLTTLTNLVTADLSKNAISQLLTENMPNLQNVLCQQNPITSLDFSSCPKLKYVGFGGNTTGPHLNYLNVKNGYSIINFAQNFVSAPLYICADEGEQAFVLNYFANKPVTVSTYCLFTPGGNYNTIAGAFTFDSDSNGCSTTDAAAQNVRIGINDGTQTGATITNNQGNYNFYTQNGNFTLTPQFENNWFTATPATATVNFANNNNNTSTQNFCIAPNGVHPDVEVVLVPENGAQPGFDARYKIIYKNKGNQTLSGNVILNYDEAVLDFVSVPSTTPSSAISGQLTWTYSNLLPFESQTINVWLNLNGPMETPSLEIDDILNYTLSITPTTGDETPLDNTFTLKQVITGAFDPNDITCLEGDSVHPNKIGDYLHYNINFENTGNAPATFIVVKDLINAQQYDINTLQMLHASHSVETRINGNKVEFFFDDINLGPLAKGNVVFKIKTQPIVAVNSTVMNKAEIFFDYNWPIVTNQAETTFEVLSAGDFAKDTSVSIYPNPAITSVNIKASTEITSVQLYDVQGRLLQAVPITSNEAVLDVSGRASGIYFVKVMTDKGIKVEKLMRK